ncbi:hypothetical protein K4F52_001161, partial [Lecanicillium sp. MT-2017a]
VPPKRDSPKPDPPKRDSPKRDSLKRDSPKRDSAKRIDEIYGVANLAVEGGVGVAGRYAKEMNNIDEETVQHNTEI